MGIRTGKPKKVRVVCVTHWKRFGEYTDKRIATGEENTLTVTNKPNCTLSGRHSFMYEDQVSKEQFKMFWQQAL
jgi:hypothetical protein